MYIYIYIQLPSAHPATVPTMLDWSIEWLINSLVVWWSVDRLVARVVAGVIQNCIQITRKSSKNLSTIYQKSIKNGSQIDQNRSTELSWRGLGPSWPQEGPKSSKKAEKWKFWPSLGGHFGAKNRSKSVPRAIRKVIVFMINLKIDFWSDLEPTWLHLGPKSKKSAFDPPSSPPCWGPKWRPKSNQNQ